MQYTALKPTISTTVVSSDQAVDGRDRSFVHSERSTLAWVTRWSARYGGSNIFAKLDLPPTDTDHRRVLASAGRLAVSVGGCEGDLTR
jgi:hypothetical protein